MKLVVVNGYPTAGKDTFIDLCIDHIGQIYCAKVSIIDWVKDIAWKCGWHGDKTDKDRTFLCELKDALSKWNDVPFNMLCKKIDDFAYETRHYGVSDSCCVFVVIREPIDIARVISRYSAVNDIEILTVFINGGNKESSNHADRSVEDYNYNVYINNNGSIEELKNIAIDFSDRLFNRGEDETFK